jgi:hypothetical protein
MVVTDLTPLLMSLFDAAIVCGVLWMIWILR